MFATLPPFYSLYTAQYFLLDPPLQVLDEGYPGTRHRCASCRIFGTASIARGSVALATEIEAAVLLAPSTTGVSATVD